MKKVLKVIGIILLIMIMLLLLLSLVLKRSANKPLYADDYYTSIPTGGELEKTYLQMGPYDNIALREISVIEDYERYLVFYPEELLTGTECFPVVIYSNGTGVAASRYQSQLKRLASWGFVVVGTDEKNSWNGFSSEMCLRLMMKLNKQEKPFDWEENPFIGHIDLERIGVIGHSQGGVGVFNTANENKHGSMVKTIVALSPTNLELAEGLEWEYDPSLVTVPTLLISGTGDGDEKFVVSGEQLKDIYDKIPNDVMKVAMRKTGVDHGDMGKAADGYITAWFMWQLKGDEEAGKAFTGTAPEFLNNALYQDGQKNFD